jgi:hypothetical protein
VELAFSHEPELYCLHHVPNICNNLLHRSVGMCRLRRMLLCFLVYRLFFGTGILNSLLGHYYNLSVTILFYGRFSKTGTTGKQVS